MEIGETVLALNFVDSEFHLTESMFLIGLEIGEGDFEDTTLQSIVGVLETCCSVDECFADAEQKIS